MYIFFLQYDNIIIQAHTCRISVENITLKINYLIKFWQHNRMSIENQKKSLFIQCVLQYSHLQILQNWLIVQPKQEEHCLRLLVCRHIGRQHVQMLVCTVACSGESLFLWLNLLQFWSNKDNGITSIINTHCSEKWIHYNVVDVVLPLSQCHSVFAKMVRCDSIVSLIGPTKYIQHFKNKATLPD